MDELESWRRAREGDGDAFASVFEMHRDRVYRHACRLSESQHDAEDVAAAAFFELWRRRDRVRIVEGSVLAWLLVTTGNVARNRVRSVRRYRAMLERLPRRAAVESEPDALHEALVSGLQVLGTTDLHLLCLVVLEGYQVKEAARLLGIADATARSRLHRARSRVRAAVREPVMEES